jgi:hypothetical protein
MQLTLVGYNAGVWTLTDGVRKRTVTDDSLATLLKRGFVVNGDDMSVLREKFDTATAKSTRMAKAVLSVGGSGLNLQGDGYVSLDIMTQDDLESDLYLPNGIVGVARNGFAGCMKIEALHCGSVSVIQSGAFGNCKNLKELDLGEVEVIESQAFVGVGVTELVLPVNLQKCAQTAFSGAPITKLTATRGSAGAAFVGLFGSATVTWL